MNQRTRLTRTLLAVIAAAMVLPLGLHRAGAAEGTSLASIGVPYVEDFDTLAPSGASGAVPAGWHFAESGANANGTYTAGTGSSTAADTYSFGASGSTERAFGALRGGALIPVIGVGFINNTGAVIDRLAISYTGEQWRAGVTGRGTADRLDFQLSLDATDLATGTWVDYDDFDFSSPAINVSAGALNGNAVANRATVSATIDGLQIPDGASFWLRWVDVDIASSDDGLAIDDFSLTPGATGPSTGPSGIGAAEPETVVAGEAVLLTVTVTPGANPVSSGLAVTGDLSAVGGATSRAFFDDGTNGDVEAADSIFSLLVHVSAETNVGLREIAITITDLEGRSGSVTIGLVVLRAVDACDLPYTPAYAIQGSGRTAAITGPVTTQGVVVGDYEGPAPNLRGFYLQDLEGDGDAATSDAVFVFNGDRADVSLGEVVRVTGSAGEARGQTQVAELESIVRCGFGDVTPVAVTLPLASVDDLERLEGMLVRLSQALFVTDTFHLGRFGEVTVSAGGRLSQPTAATLPGASANLLQAENDLNRIVIDDAFDGLNPDPISFGRLGLPLSAGNTLRAGDTAADTVGVLTASPGGDGAGHDGYRVRPFGALAGHIDFQPSNPRPIAQVPIGGDLRVAGFNLSNFFNSFTGCAAGVGGEPVDCRGAANEGEFARQWPKTVAAILAADADVLGVMEVENDGYGAGSALHFLVEQLNAASTPGTYAYVDVDTAAGRTNAAGLDAVKVGLVYRSAAVALVGRTATLDTPTFITGGDGAARNRASLVQAFQARDTGAVFVVNVNHLKGRGTPCDTPDAGDGQGNCSDVRTRAVGELLAWLAGDPTGTGDPDVLMLGDFNAYAREDPVMALVGAGFRDLLAGQDAPAAYSYAFGGQWGYVDHALGSSSIVSQVAGTTVYHVNADEPAVLDYRAGDRVAAQADALYAPDAFRSSDHDLVLVGLDLQAPPVVTAGGPYTVREGAWVTLSAVGSDPEDGLLTYAWDLDDDGTFESEGQQACFSAVAMDGPQIHAVTVRAMDPTGLAARDRTTVLVLNAPPGVSAGPRAQNVQYSDPVVPVVVTAVDIAADVALAFESDWSLNGGELASGLPGWLSLGTDGCEVTGATGRCEWTLSGRALAAPGSYVVRVKVSDKDGATSAVLVAYEVVPDDARATYTGALYASTSSGSSGAATVTLAATVQDGALGGDGAGDGWPGDIRHARVTFIDRSTNVAIEGCADLPLGLVNSGDVATGTAACEWEVSIDGDAQDFTIGVVVSGYYVRDAAEDDVVVMVARPLAGNFIAGGGHIVLEQPNGERAGDPGTSVNFGFNVRYNKKGTNLQGAVNIIVRRTEADGPHVYQIKANAVTSLAVQSEARAASFEARASIQDITDPLAPVSIDGNAVLHVTMTDRGEPGFFDGIGITVWNKNGGLWFASHWTGVRTVEQRLAGGNLVVN